MDTETSVLSESMAGGVIDAARTGAEWAWERIYRQFAPAIRGYLRAQGAREPDDLTSEVFVDMVRNLPGFTGESGFRAWVFMIAHHRLSDERRRLARRPIEVAPEAGESTRIGGDAEQEALAALGLGHVTRVLGRLAPAQRSVLLLRILGDLTVEDVAGILGKRLGAVKALQHRGVAALRREIAAGTISL